MYKTLSDVLILIIIGLLTAIIVTLSHETSLRALNPRITKAGVVTTPCSFSTPFFPRGFYGNASVYLSAIHSNITSSGAKISEKIFFLVNLYTKM